MATLEVFPPSRDQLGHFLQVEIDSWRLGCVRGPAAAIAGVREHPAEIALGRGDAGQCGADTKGGAANDLASNKWLCPAHSGKSSPMPREQIGVSEPRACALVGVSRRVIHYEPSLRDDGRCGNGCASWRRSVAGLAVAAWAACWRGRGSRLPKRSCCAFTAMRACGCGASAAGNGRWARKADGAAGLPEPALVA